MFRSRIDRNDNARPRFKGLRCSCLYVLTMCTLVLADEHVHHSLNQFHKPRASAFPKGVWSVLWHPNLNLCLISIAITLCVLKPRKGIPLPRHAMRTCFVLVLSLFPLVMQSACAFRELQ